jgi:hypothetical protein
MKHHCKQGGEGQVVRDGDSYAVPVYRCTRPCGAYWAVFDGEPSDPSATTETP